MGGTAKTGLMGSPSGPPGGSFGGAVGNSKSEARIERSGTQKVPAGTEAAKAARPVSPVEGGGGSSRSPTSPPLGADMAELMSTLKLVESKVDGITKATEGMRAGESAAKSIKAEVQDLLKKLSSNDGGLSRIEGQMSGIRSEIQSLAKVRSEVESLKKSGVALSTGDAEGLSNKIEARLKEVLATSLRDIPPAEVDMSPICKAVGDVVRDSMRQGTAKGAGSNSRREDVRHRRDHGHGSERRRDRGGRKPGVRGAGKGRKIRNPYGRFGPECRLNGRSPIDALTALKVAFSPKRRVRREDR